MYDGPHVLHYYGMGTDVADLEAISCGGCDIP
jgi:hypothetical protein